MPIGPKMNPRAKMTVGVFPSVTMQKKERR
jgi:hypothetical protein